MCGHPQITLHYLQESSMFNWYRLRVSPSDLGGLFRWLGTPLEWSDGGTPNLELRDEIGVRDTAPIIRLSIRST
jgi:hypothetical protein